MKMNSVNFCIYGQHKNVEAVSGRYTYDFETKQIATYTVSDGFATITALTPSIATKLAIQLPLIVPVRDLGSSWLTSINFNADTLTADESICPRAEWITRKTQATPKLEQLGFMPDYIGLL